MRLLILTPEFERGGGIATFYRHLAPALGRLGVEVRIIEGSAFHAGSAAPRSVDGVSVETLELDRLNRWAERFSALAATPGLRRHLAAAWAMWEQAGRGAEADVVEAADWGLLYVPAAIEVSRTLVVQGHGSIGQISVHDPLAGEETQNALTRLIESAVLARVQTVQTYSRANAEFWECETGRPVDMIRPALRTTPGAPPEAISSRGLVAGRIQRWKGPDVLCRALALMGNAAPGVDWLGRDTSSNRREVSTASELARLYPQVWGRLVRPAPPVPPEEVAGRQSRVLFNLVPSEWDVFNFTVVEAMASGRPTLVSSGAGASELVTEGETGFLFEAGNSASLAVSLDKLLSMPPARLAEIGGAARETVRRECDPDVIAGARLAAYRRAIADFAQSPQSPVDGWIGAVCRPNAATEDVDEFLGQFPIRSLTRHVARRLRERTLAPLRTRRP